VRLAQERTRNITLISPPIASLSSPHLEEPASHGRHGNEAALLVRRANL
jgi:hypothetical protein